MHADGGETAPYRVNGRGARPFPARNAGPSKGRCGAARARQRRRILRRVRAGATAVTSRRREWSAVALMPLAAVLVHELRYLFAFGPAAAGRLAETGHSYLHELAPWIVTAYG